ncbi:MAG: electron transport complex subunit RsxA [Phycisphaerales bacterium]|nr:electron transport complex subunit RsxA [Phycisphaerales bacterium]
MDLGQMAAIFLGVVLVNNLVLSGFLGICPFLGVSRKIDMAFGMGCAVTFVITVAGAVTWTIMHGILEPLSALLFRDAAGEPIRTGLNVLQYVAFIMVIASMVQLVEMYLKKFFPPLYTALGVFLPLITTNCAIMGACLYIYMKPETQPFINALTYAFGGGIGFTIAIVMMAGIREHLRFSDIPKPLQGAGITLLTAGILALAFGGFAGLGK